jgi:hypothetical protein
MKLFNVLIANMEYHDIREATEALAKRKFGERGVYNPNTPGA